MSYKTQDFKDGDVLTADQLNAMDAQIKTIDEQTTSMDTQITSIGGKVTTMDTQVKTINSQIATMNEQITKNEAALLTEDDVNSLIDAKLGVIENGSY